MADELPARKQTVAEMEAENKALRAQLDKINEAKKAESAPGWFRCWLDKLPGMATVVRGNGKTDGIRQFCARMGIQWTVKRKDAMLNVSADQVTPADIANGAAPNIGDGRIVAEPMGNVKPSIDAHVRTMPGTGAKQVLYSRRELAELGYTAEEVALVA